MTPELPEKCSRALLFICNKEQVEPAPPPASPISAHFRHKLETTTHPYFPKKKKWHLNAPHHAPLPGLACCCHYEHRRGPLNALVFSDNGLPTHPRYGGRQLRGFHQWLQQCLDCSYAFQIRSPLNPTGHSSDWG